jgi:hypothetical protein
LIENLIGPSVDAAKQLEEALKPSWLERNGGIAHPLFPSIHERFHLPELPPIEQTPVGRTAKATEQLVSTADELKGVVHIAAAHLSSLTQTAISLAVDAEKKREQDLQHLKTNIRIAAYSLCVAVALGVLSVTFAAGSLWVAYETRKDAVRAAEEAQTQAKATLAESSAEQKVMRDVRDSIDAQTASVSQKLTGIAETLKQERSIRSEVRKAPPPRPHTMKRE